MFWVLCIFRILPVQHPFQRIVDDIFPHLPQFPFIADHPFEIVALPQCTAKRFPSVLFDTVDVSVRRYGFEPMHNIRQRQRELIGRGRPQGVAPTVESVITMIPWT